jgi:putative colanic acid biosynthesis acetyltransferase WcaF
MGLAKKDISMAVAVDLSRFDNTENAHAEIGRCFFTRTAWFFLGLPLLRCSILPSSSFRRRLLTLFGATIGEGAVIKPGVRVKFPWKLKAGRHCWFGEDSWIDNIAPVTLGDHVCISQGVYLCTGNHDWSDPAFRLMAGPIRIESGAWVASRAVLGPGSVIGECAVVGFGAVVNGSVPPYEIHAGNPARFLRHRSFKTVEGPFAAVEVCHGVEGLKT